MTVFQVSKINKVGRTEPLLDDGRVCFRSYTMEGRVSNSIMGTVEMGTDEKEDVEE